jgi:hypothetical protein
LRIADCGLGIEEERLGIVDWGEAIADFGLLIAEERLGIVDCGLRIYD